MLDWFTSVPEEGPNQVVAAENIATTDLFTPVRIRISEKDGMGRWTPTSLPGILLTTVSMNPLKVALAYKKQPEDKEFQYINYRDYYAMTKTVAKAFLRLGLKRLHCVAIIGFNCPEWFLSYLGCICAGGVACAIYTTNSAEAIFYCLERGHANLAVVENDELVQKILKFKEDLPKLKAIIQYQGAPLTKGVLSWNELILIGTSEDETNLDIALKRIAVNECCTLIFTSGTTGAPKGVMLSHDNLVWNARTAVDTLKMSDDERMISFLPLSHIAALLVDVYIHVVGQVTIYFANKDALKGGLLKTLVEVRPTRFLAVPRVWEKLATKLKTIISESGPIKRCIVSWARARGTFRNLELMKGYKNHSCRMTWHDEPTVAYFMAKSLVFTKLKSKLGLDQCRSCWSGAAPLAYDIKLFLASLDLLILDTFGLSECSGVHSCNFPWTFKLDSVGKTMPGAKTRIQNPDSHKQGEVCVIGRHVFMGYMDHEEQTMEAIDENGWLHTGDIGKLEKDGFLHITGRIKELLITAGGENVCPLPIEQNVKAQLPFLGQAVVICENKKFLSLLITLSSEVNPETGEPIDELAASAKAWLRELGFSFTKMSQVLASGPDRKIMDAIQKGIDIANEKAISHAQRIQKFVLLPRDFSFPTGELGPTLKLKRNAISEKYKRIIELLYSS